VWTAAHVQAWLGCMSLGRYSAAFAANAVEGKHVVWLGRGGGANSQAEAAAEAERWLLSLGVEVRLHRRKIVREAGALAAGALHLEVRDSLARRTPQHTRTRAHTRAH
jgi:hypothetical protein